jgi:REP element-mobilizing transposase RayT
MPKINVRKPRNRLEDYDYSRSGYCFVTTCTNNHEEFFGKIDNNEMVLNKYGYYVKEQWEWLAQKYPYVITDEFIIMPNHLHGILIIKQYPECTKARTGRDLSLHGIKSLSSLIGAFKTTSSKIIRQNGLSNFKWQRSFHDHIIRNNKSLQNIREYIQNNPAKWDIDEENINNKQTAVG